MERRIVAGRGAEAGEGPRQGWSRRNLAVSLWLCWLGVEQKSGKSEGDEKGWARFTPERHLGGNRKQQ